MKKLWFKAKTYGWGWYPASWEGWAVTLGWVAVFALSEVVYLRALKAQSGAWWVTALFLAFTAIDVAALIAIAYKTGEKPEWRWGRKK